MQIGRLLVHTLSPTLPLSDRKEALEFVFDSRHLDILKESLSPSLEVMFRLHNPHTCLYRSYFCDLQREKCGTECIFSPTEGL